MALRELLPTGKDDFQHKTIGELEKKNLTFRFILRVRL